MRIRPVWRAGRARSNPAGNQIGTNINAPVGFEADWAYFLNDDGVLSLQYLCYCLSRRLSEVARHGVPDLTVVSFLESFAMFDISPIDISISVSPTVQFPCDGHRQILTGNR